MKNQSQKQHKQATEVRKLLYKVKSSTGSDGNVVYSVFSCIDDIEHRRHRRNPFDLKYMQAALSSFEVVGGPTREEVEAASTNVHIRVELIKSMKDGLMKLTTEAVKHWNGPAKKVHKSLKEAQENKPEFHAVEMPIEENPAAPVNVQHISKDHMVKAGLLLEKSLTSLDLGIAQVVKKMEDHLNEYTTFLSEDELCFNLKKETMEVPQIDSLRVELENQVEEWLEQGGYGDLSPFKGCISSITKDLVLDYDDAEEEDITPLTNLDTKGSEMQEAELGTFEEEIETSEMNLEICNEKFLINPCGELPHVGNVDMEIMEDDISESSGGDTCENLDKHNLPVDTIMEKSKLLSPVTRGQKVGILSDDEVEEENSVPVEASDDVHNRMNGDIKTCFRLEDDNIDKFIQYKRQYRKGRNFWYVQNPEKLLCPLVDDMPFLYDDFKLEDQEEYTRAPIVTSMNAFRQALSRPGVDLVERYDMMHMDPSKISGALQFCLNEDGPQEDASPGMGDTLLQGQEESTICESSCIMEDQEDCIRFEASQSWSSSCPVKGIAASTEQAWDTFSWSSELADCGVRGDTKKSWGDCKGNLINLNVLDRDATRDANLSTQGGFRKHLTMHSGELEAGIEDLSVRPTSMSPCGSRRYQHFQANFDSKEATKEVTVADSHIDSYACEPLMTEDASFSTEMAGDADFPITEPREDEQRNVYDGQVTISQKKLYFLDELITDAVMAECQLQQKAFSYHDLEPISQALLIHIVSFYEKQNSDKIIFKDIIDSCMLDSSPLNGKDITLQRYFIALLSLAHQQNIGCLKDSSLADLRIIIERSLCGNLIETIIHLMPESQMAA